MPSVFLSVHEASGDNSTADLVSALHGMVRGRLETFGLGGPQMAAAGVDLWKDTTQHSLMGITEVVGEIPRVLREIRQTARRVAALQPDVAILVDAPDYNIRLAKALKRARPDLPIVYFLCPQIWAWRIGRVAQLRKYFDHLFCILPFEPKWYRQFYTDAEFIGHPAVGRVAKWRTALEADAQAADAPDGRTHLRRQWGVTEDEPVLAILPGSRGKEVRNLLDVQLQAAQLLNARRTAAGQMPYRPIVSCAPSRDPDSLRPYLARTPVPGTLIAHVGGTAGPDAPDSAVRRGSSWDICAAADVGAICSGTATVETALIGLPQVVMYRSSRLSWFILMRLVTVRFASIINLVVDREVIPEKLQHFCTPEGVADTLHDLTQPDRLATLQTDYAEVQRLLGHPDGPARAARRIADRFMTPLAVPADRT